MNTMTITPKMTKAEVIEEYKTFIRGFGKGFHPDTDAYEYSPPLSDAEALDLNTNLDILHRLLGDEIYTIGLEVFKSM